MDTNHVNLENGNPWQCQDPGLEISCRNSPAMVQLPVVSTKARTWEHAKMNLGQHHHACQARSEDGKG